ncbi:MAG TPA: ATP-dependent DNA helicase RecG, partial [Beijerinckiaceae bacterium]|nr:ATP-dependent DNA helicase RecG [Beijerinckiaceae bacterium]
MRPSVLNPLFAPAEGLPGVGPKFAALLRRLVGRDGAPAQVVDLLFHLPFSTIDRRSRRKIAQAERGATVLFEAKVLEHRPPDRKRARAPFRVVVADETGDVELVFFLANHAWIERSLPIGAKRWISGKLELWDGHLQIVHPDRVLDEAGVARLPPVEPVYPLTDGLHQSVMQRACAAALARAPKFAEWLDGDFGPTRGFPSFGDALGAVHHPSAPEAIELTSPARLRLAYDELLAGQLALLLVRSHMRRQQGRAHVGAGALAAKIEAGLPYSLTASQVQATAEIRSDLGDARRMLRLLQGDVGSGKTIVALLAMACVVEAGRQAALMAPTEILARQHFETIAPLAAQVGLRLALLTGRDTQAQRRKALADIAEGAVDIVVGTHALLQESVAYRDLGLAVVDEQHRFGVHQRLALGEKGEAADILVMTATPIPRTLVLTYFGDMDVSTLPEKPPGRQAIETRALPSERIDAVVAAVGRAIAAGAQVYWVCPLVEENEELDVAAASDRYEALRQVFGERVGLVHGRMKSRDKDSAMDSFRQGETRVLVATTVIEVGVDVPAATVMIIEHAERFGLAQLHQLRGRVGRGSGGSTCLLLYKAPLSATAKARINVMRETQDGFRIAEEDLRLRGEGEVLGARQSGTPGFRLARLEVHAALLNAARRDAEKIFETDPQLETERGQALKTLLYLFGQDEAARL